MITDEELNEIEARANAATPGLWETCIAPWDDSISIIVKQTTVAKLGAPSCDTENYLENAIFIVHARSDVPRLVNEVKRQRAILETVRHYCETETDTRELYRMFQGAEGGLKQEIDP
ncbi:MAG: hypothetical protein FWH15_07695 [Betaproteobacteria bacterium]|nr:hypothetical protein [Betaproteobacteria bacterium]